MTTVTLVTQRLRTVRTLITAITATQSTTREAKDMAKTETNMQVLLQDDPLKARATTTTMCTTSIMGNHLPQRTLEISTTRVAMFMVITVVTGTRPSGSRPTVPTPSTPTRTSTLRALRKVCALASPLPRAPSRWATYPLRSPLDKLWVAVGSELTRGIPLSTSTQRPTRCARVLHDFKTSRGGVGFTHDLV
jgi:hypothetical protein